VCASHCNLIFVPEESNMLLSRIKIRTRLQILTLIFSLALVVVGAAGLYSLKHMGGSLHEANNELKHIVSFSEMDNQLLQIRLNLVYMMALNDPEQIKAKVADLDKRSQRIHELLTHLEKSELEQKEKEYLAQFKSGYTAYLAQGLKLAEAIKAAIDAGSATQRDAALSFAVTTVAPLYAKPAEAIAGIMDFNIKSNDATYASDMSRYQTTFGFMIALIGGAIFGGVALGTIIARSCTVPLARMLEMLKDIANGDGDLTKRLAVTGNDEVAQLGSSFNTFVEKLHDIIVRVSRNSSLVASAAVELSATAEQMALGTEHMTNQISSVSIAGEEMSATSGDIAKNCAMAAEGSGRASDSARLGAEVVNESIVIMNRIAGRVQQSAATVSGLGARSDQIGEIIGTIEDIADQTNLLALNAAIEAARAGEQGRGFAVVADEVRALAERTTRATKEISAMIRTIQQETRQAALEMEQGVGEVSKGTEEAARSGSALGEILELIYAVSSQVNQIAIAAEEQTATTAEISNNIMQASNLVTATARGTEETAVAANELAKLSDELNLLVGRFKLA
jgi:methyl-accepting chemotaxis protein